MRERDYEQQGRPEGGQGLGGPAEGLGGQGLGGYGWKSEQGGQGLGQGFGQQQEQSQQGPFAGRGPRGYRRSDERIREDVADRLTEHGDVDASEIELDVRDGVVTLSGTVEDRRQKRLAEDAAESVSGVVDVNNRLELRGHSQGQASGPDQSQGQGLAGGEAQPDYAARDYASGGSDATVATGTGTREASTATAQPVESGGGREAQPVMGAGTSDFSGDQGAAPVGTVPRGSAVFTSDGQKLGEVTDGNENFLVVQKGGIFSKDILIPRAAVTGVEGERVHVSATKEEAEHLTSEQ